MLVLEQIRHGISFKTVWYATERITGKGIISYREAQFQDNSATEVFSTLISDLTISEEEIIQKFTKSCKYKVNRAPREGVICQECSGEKVTGAEIDKFISFYVDFWKSKNVEFELNKRLSLKNELLLYAESGALCITKAILDGEVVVYHTYVTDGIHGRLLHSASLFRTEDSGKSNIVGIANRYLHKQDMLMFKKQGVQIYDWGGAGTADDVKHITEFKASFGGTPKNYFEYYEVKGVRAKMFVLLAKILHR